MLKNMLFASVLAGSALFFGGSSSGTEAVLEETERITEDLYDAYEKVAEDESPMGNYGRFYIPDRDINVAINHYDYDSSSAETLQAVTDWQDSALFTYYLGGAPYIADHWNQGFIGIRETREGDVAFLKRTDGSIEVYECTLYDRGHNADGTLYTGEWIPTQDIDCDLYCYTCNEGGWRDISIAFFDRIE